MNSIHRFVGVVAVFLGCVVLLTAQPQVGGVNTNRATPGVIVDGILTDALYVTVATKVNTNAGFGSTIDVSRIVAYVDTGGSALYLGVVGKMDVTKFDGIGVWLNVGGAGSPVGTPAGTPLSTTSGGHYMGGGGGGGFKADFEVDYMFAFNPGSGATTVYFDAVKRVGTPAAEYQGYCDQAGTSAADSNAAGLVFSNNSVQFAFKNDGLAYHGLELRIPLAQIGATKESSIQVFAFVVSSTAYFSDVTVPGNRTGGNPGFNADFSTLGGGPYNATVLALTAVNPGLGGASAIPRTLAIFNNYPNPFNPTSTVEFTVSQSGPATVKVYNVLGQEVATLFNGEAVAGTLHRALFSASNLPSGLYLARVESAGQHAVRKLMCLK